MDELFLKGTNACAGCGPSIAIRQILETLGREIVVVNATGCMEVVSTQYPESCWNVAYIHSVFENAPAVAGGVARAFKKLGKKGTVVCIGGDGSTYDIGFGALSGAMERNEDMIYICYDNNGYMNTGVQRSGGTPFGAWTTTSPNEVHGKREWQKPLPFIAAAHAIPYVATASISFRNDLEDKLRKAMERKGFRYIHVHAPCPIGWKFPVNMTIECGKLAVEAGLWSLYEIDDGRFRRTYKPSPLKPVGEFFRMQGRFKNLSAEDEKLIQDHVKRTQEELEKLEKCGVNERFFQ